MSNDLLIVLPEKDRALEAFSGDFDAMIGPLLKPIEDTVQRFIATRDDDNLMATERGRAEIKAFAHKLARSKTALDEAGKAVNAELKRLPKTIDANRAKAWDQIEKWQDQVRAPLTLWETNEAQRIKRHVDTIAAIRSQYIPTELTVAELETRVVWVTSLRSIDGEEFTDEYRMAIGDELKALDGALELRRTYEAEQVELAALRAAKAAQNASEKATRDAEALERANKEREIAEVARVEAEARAAEQAIVALHEGAERRRLEDAARAQRERDAVEAARVERERQQKIADDTAEKRRQENRNHQGRIHREAAAGIAQLLRGYPDMPPCDDLAVDIVRSIIIGQIPHVTINY